jgi:hypothetical protein
MFVPNISDRTSVPHLKVHKMWVPQNMDTAYQCLGKVEYLTGHCKFLPLNLYLDVNLMF